MKWPASPASLVGLLILISATILIKSAEARLNQRRNSQFKQFIAGDQVSQIESTPFSRTYNQPIIGGGARFINYRTNGGFSSGARSLKHSKSKFKKEPKVRNDGGDLGNYFAKKPFLKRSVRSVSKIDAILEKLPKLPIVDELRAELGECDCQVDELKPEEKAAEKIIIDEPKGFVEGTLDKAAKVADHLVLDPIKGAAEKLVEKGEVVKGAVGGIAEKAAFVVDGAVKEVEKIEKELEGEGEKLEAHVEDKLHEKGIIKAVKSEPIFEKGVEKGKFKHHLKKKPIKGYYKKPKVSKPLPPPPQAGYYPPSYGATVAQPTYAALPVPAKGQTSVAVVPYEASQTGYYGSTAKGLSQECSRNVDFLGGFLRKLLEHVDKLGDLLLSNTLVWFKSRDVIEESLGKLINFINEALYALSPIKLDSLQEYTRKAGAELVKLIKLIKGLFGLNFDFEILEQLAKELRKAFKQFNKDCIANEGYNY